MPQQPRLDVLERQRLAQQRIREQVDLPDREVVRGAPVGVQALPLVGAQGSGSADIGCFVETMDGDAS
jgi:hypothetical protein